MVTERVRRCGWRKVCFFVFLCGREYGCRWENVRVRKRVVNAKRWTMELNADLASADLSTPIVLTAADQVDSDLPPIRCVGPKGVVFDIAADSDTWWIVVGADVTGTVSGAFEARVGSEILTGTFVGVLPPR